MHPMVAWSSYITLCRRLRNCGKCKEIPQHNKTCPWRRILPCERHAVANYERLQALRAVNPWDYPLCGKKRKGTYKIDGKGAR